MNQKNAFQNFFNKIIKIQVANYMRSHNVSSFIFQETLEHGDIDFDKF